MKACSFHGSLAVSHRAVIANVVGLGYLVLDELHT
jgi:hypothetical protein